MSDNPFAEPDDVDRTIVRPMPGGRTSQAQPPPPPIAPRPTRPVQLEDVGPAPIETIASGVSPLAAAAAPLLQLLARLRNVARPPDPGELRQRALNAVRAFERKATESGVPAEELRLANFVLCASVDDVVMNTPWGSTGVWEAHSLVAAFHGKVDAGERFFSLLTKLREFPAKNLQILELMYLCLSLGFMGRYRLSPRGPAEIDRLREETYSVIVRNRAPAELELSPHWQGVAAPYRAKRGTIPIWAAGATALTIVAALFGWSSFRLADTSDQLYQKMISAPPDHMPAIARAAPVQPPIEPPPVEPTALDRLRGFLQPEIDEGLVTVLGTQSTPIVRISNKGMFLSGSAS
ncbi:MAG: type IVB secretion system protein IcmH/DotU, partial [Acetobacteraceae bacterium]|nr:type IVB secretion system protein IcmH/DotU [Acetobacteraceae bacterium]